MSTTVDLGKITASVTVGTTTTGAAGTNASVSNSGTTQDAVLNFTIPRGAQGVQGPQGSTGPQGPAGPTGPQGPMGDVAVITPEQQAAFTMYSTTGQNTDGPMTQKAVTDVLVADAISYDNSQSGLASNNVQGALDEQSEEFTELVADVKTAGLPELSGTQIQNLYIDHTTGVVKSNTAQRSYKYAVNKGDYIVYNYRCDASYSQRYGFIAGEPAVDVKAYDYGVHLSRTSGVDIMRAPVNGYFLVSNGGSVYPVCNVMGVSSKLFKYEEHSNIFTHKGYLNSSDGTIKSSSSYVYSNKIKVQEGDVVTVIGGGTYNISTIVMYGSNDSIISYSAPPTTTVCTTIKVIPSGVSYIRACTKLTALSISKILVIRKISDELDKIKDDIYGLDVRNEEFYTGFYYLADGSFCAANQVSNRKMSDIHPVVEGEVLEYNLYNTSSTLSLCAFDSNLDLVLASSLVGNTSSYEGEYTVPKGISYVMGIKSPGSIGYIRSKNRGILPKIENLETQLNNISETDILLNRVGVTTKIYTDHTTGVVTTADSQRGYLYEVKGGDVIKIVDSDLTNNHRYGFFSAYPNIGSQALSYGLEHSEETILTAPTGTMYLMINNNASYPPVTLYLQGSPSSSATRIAEYSDVLRVFKGERKYIYGYKYNIDINYLGTRSGATLADGVLSVSSGGSAQSAYDLYDDEVRMSCKIKPTSDTFDIRFGRYNTTNGTLIGLRKDSNGSFLDLYKATTLIASYVLPFALANGVEYFVNITKFTLDNTYIDIAIISNDGRNYRLLVGTPENKSIVVGADVVQLIGKLWGKVYLASSSGSFEASSFNMYSPYRMGCQVAVIGHSFVEGNSIEGMKLKKFSKLLQGELGIKECGVYGRGGGSMAQSLDVLQHYVGVFHNPKYVLLCVGTNDNSMTLTNWKTWANNVISACESINATPVFFTIPPDSGAYEGQWNSINAFIRTSGYKYVDMDKCFVNSNGNPILSDYLYDRTHPNPETHYAIFQRILADVPEILDLWSQ